MELEIINVNLGELPQLMELNDWTVNCCNMFSLWFTIRYLLRTQSNQWLFFLTNVKCQKFVHILKYYIAKYLSDIQWIYG